VKRTINKSSYFLRQIKKIDFSEESVLELENLFYSSDFNPNIISIGKHNAFCSEGEYYQIWCLRIPNKQNNTGKSSGYRLLYYYLPNENIVCFYFILPRKDAKKPYNKKLDELKKYLKSTSCET